MAIADKLLTGTELATEMRVKTGTVSGWKADGCPWQEKGGRPMYVLHKVVDWRLAQARAATTPLDKEAEQVRKLKAEADRVEIEVAQARGELVPVAEFDRVVAVEHEYLRTALVKMPSTFADMVAERTGCPIGVAQSVLADVVDATLTSLQEGAE